MDDHDADQEGDESQFIGCAEGGHRAIEFSLPSPASVGVIVVYCDVIASRKTLERAGRTR